MYLQLFIIYNIILWKRNIVIIKCNKNIAIIYIIAIIKYNKNIAIICIIAKTVFKRRNFFKYFTDTKIIIYIQTLITGNYFILSLLRNTLLINTSIYISFHYRSADDWAVLLKFY